MHAVQTVKLCKQFKTVKALDGADLCVEEGELFGLLGVNGAGKTTLIRILSGLIKPTSGEAFVLGKSVLTEMAQIKEIIDVSPQETSVALKLTVKENLEFFATVYCADKNERQERINEVIETFQLEEVLNRQAKTLSGGWQRRLSIAAALISRPKVLFLDEPTLGLDVLARRELWRVIEKLKGKITIVLTSHYLEEIEALCDRVAIMKKGKIIADGTVEEIKGACNCQSFEDAFVQLVQGEEK